MSSVPATAVKIVNVPKQKKNKNKRKNKNKNNNNNNKAIVVLPNSGSNKTSVTTGQPALGSSVLSGSFKKPTLSSIAPPPKISEQVLRFGEQLMNPSGATTLVRMPDSFSRPTAMTREVCELQVSCYFSNPATADDGRFSVCVQPLLGDITTPSHFKAALVNGNAAWPSDFTQVGTYSALNNGFDPRLSNYLQQLTQSNNFFFHADGATFSGNCPFGTTYVIGASSYGLNPIINSNTIAGSNTFTLPPGQYNFSYYIVAANNGSPLSFTFGGTGLGTYVSVLGVVSSGAGLLTGEGIVSIQDNSTTFVVTGTGSITAAPTSAHFAFGPCFTPAAPIPLDFGMVSSIRPVAMSVLFTATQSLLNASGMVASAWIPGGGARSAFFSNSPNQSVGHLSDWESLAKMPLAYSGKFVDGTYLAWKHEDMNDMQFWDPSKMFSNDYPSLVVSGQFMTPPSSIPASVILGRLEICVIWEFETMALMFELSTLSGPSSELEILMMFLSQVSMACGNPNHTSVLRRMATSLRDFLRKGIGFYMQNRNWINPAVLSLGSVLGI